MSGQFKRPSPPPTGRPVSEKPPEPKREPTQPLEKKGIADELRINDLRINEELIGQPLLMHKYCEILGALNKKVKSIENKLKTQEAALYVMLSNDGRGRKVDEIKAMVIQDVTVQELRVQLYDAEEEAEVYDGIVKSIIHRKDSLQQLANNQRKELA